MPESAHDKLLNIARALFWKYGFGKVTVEEICKEASMSKMTFYRAFKNKADIAESVIDKLISEGSADYEEVMGSDKPFPEKLEKLLDVKYRHAQNISEAFIKDLYGKNKILASKLRQGQLNQMERIKRDFSKAQEEGWINRELSMDFILYMLNDLNAKMKDENLLMMYTHPSKLIMHLTQFFFNGISNPKNSK
jgi:AcrR family transcriptional regulator